MESLATAIAIFGLTAGSFYNRAFVVLWHFKASGLDTEPQIGELLELLWRDRQLPELVDFTSRSKTRYSLGDLAPAARRTYASTRRGERSAHGDYAPSIWRTALCLQTLPTALCSRRSTALIEVQLETINNLHEGVAVHGQDGRLRLWNETLVVMWKFDHGFLKADMSAKCWSDRKICSRRPTTGQQHDRKQGYR